ncbi:hypothetical protein Leryth_008096 [Lithospermum erythrorhizon]|nr:hypothetical protein Leryth_008096 [Lithospermum erythrorhizon]
MPITSISLIRFKPPPPFSSTFRRRFFTISAASSRQNPSTSSRKLPHHQQQQPSKNLLKARDTVKKHLSSLAPILSPDEKVKLASNQAVGLVSASQANFMRVVIQSPPQANGTQFDEFVDLEASRSSGIVSDARFSRYKASGNQIEKLDENRDKFVNLEASRSSADVSDAQFSQYKASGNQIEKLDKNGDQFVNLEASRSSADVYNAQLGENGDEFVNFEASRSSADLSDARFSRYKASGAQIEKLDGNRDEFVNIEASRSCDDVSHARFLRYKPFGAQKLDENGDEFVKIEASRSFADLYNAQLDGNGDEFVKIEGSRSSDDVSGDQFSQSKASGSDFSVLEASRSYEDLNGKNRDEFVMVEGSRSPSDVSGVQFLHSIASGSEFSEFEASSSSGEGLNENVDGFVNLECSGRPEEVSGIRFSQSEGPIEKLEENLGKGIEAKRGVELLCVVKAVLKKIKRRVLVGDKVLVGSIDWVDRRGMIENVFERRSEVLDPPVANVDHLVVLFSMDQPKIEPFALTRFLVEAESTGIPFFLALNKSELVDEETLFEWKARLRKWGYDPVFCSIESKRGLDSLQFLLREQTSVIVGPSGVGKSSLINALRGNNPVLGVQQDDNWLDHILGSKWLEDQRVGEISMRSGRGKHTTRHVSLLPLTGGGYLADTPGFNQPSLIKVTKQSLAHHFPEVRKMVEDSQAKKCSFSNCLHIGEPGCVVKGDWERYPYYLQLLDEIRIREEFQLRTVGTKRESDVRYKTGELGVVQAEPRLEPKKHRRVSRKKANQSFMDDLDEFDDDDEDLLDENPVIRAVREEQL